MIEIGMTDEQCLKLWKEAEIFAQGTESVIAERASAPRIPLVDTAKTAP